MGKKHEREKGGSRKINVEIAPGNQEALDRHIEAYNARPDRRTPKVKYTDVVNEALDRLFNSHPPAARVAKEGKKKED